MSLFDDAAHYWKLNEAAGAARVDSKGTATMNEIGGNVQSAAGIRNNCANGNTDTKYLTAAFGVPSAATIGFWVNMGGTPPVDFFYIYQGNGVFDPYILLDGFGDVIFGSNNDGDLISVGLGALSAWHLVVLTLSGGTWSASIDNSAFTSAAATADDGTGTFQSILGAGAGDPFNGKMDEAAFWNRAISQGEVSSWYNGGAGLFLDSATVAGPTAVELALRKPTARIVTLL